MSATSIPLGDGAAFERRATAVRRLRTALAVVAIAAVEPRTKASAWPLRTRCSSTRRWTSAVMSITSASPRVEKLSWAVWMAIAPS